MVQTVLESYEVKKRDPDEYARDMELTLEGGGQEHHRVNRQVRRDLAEAA